MCKEIINDQSTLPVTVSGGVLVVQNKISYKVKSNKDEANLSSMNSASIFDDDSFQWAKPIYSIVVAFW